MVINISEDIRPMSDLEKNAAALKCLLLVAEQDVKAGRVSDASTFFEEFRRDHEISDTYRCERASVRCLLLKMAKG